MSTGFDAALPSRAPEQIALTGHDVDAADRRQLVGRLDALGHDRRVPPSGQLLEGTQDRERRVVQDATLDQREVDLDDVELDLAQEPEPGVAGPDVVSGQPESGPPTGRRIAAKALEILDFLALGELDHDLRRRDATAFEDRRQRHSDGTARTRGSGVTG